ncbi:O-antigen ligase family protein [Rufibacter glacialis]|uniref:O-antigen ligase family protein n=1 Tax=Rufibacter glacialis TaxID=1259555 RepID=A0A5M8QRR3_9BACT|nr:O-antigen ligase family protein [Rufibacter glacialis]KAA6437740.1 O-antigen ligase family protein [Rufibacter glacialis]GGK56718.1 membrane protein [Rufibacter glacialis]
MEQIARTTDKKSSFFLIPLAVLAAIGVGWMTAQVGFLVPGLVLALLLVVPLVYLIFKEPRIGIISLVSYCFIYNLFAREIGHFQYLYIVDALVVLSWLAALFHTTKDYDWSLMRNEICVLGAIWTIINILEIFNPAGSSLLGWMLEMRYHLLWILVVPLCLVVFNRNKDLNAFLILLICMSLLATINGVKQVTIGLFPGELEWLNSYGYMTHLIWGELRVFSFFSDASQFGASQAHMFVIAFTLALGPFKRWKKVLCGLAALAFLYGESISGTRGALFTLFIGLGVVLLITKNLKVIGIALVFAVVGFCFLKFTYIGESHFEIRRMRSALSSNDASFNIRLSNQLKLKEYLAEHPFGGGVGAIGYTGEKYNKGTYLATIPPDSYWVKVWAEYGIVGFVIWISMMMYIIGKSCGIVWNTKDKGLRFKLTALTAGFTGIVISSYGNEIMNMQPSSMILFVSWAFIFLGPKLDKEATSLEAHA